MEHDGAVSRDVDTNVIIGEEPKRRGRPSVALQQACDETVKKKRGRKPSGKIIDLNKLNIGNDYNECIIAHLPLSQKDITKISIRDSDIKGPIEEETAMKKATISLNINDDVTHTPHTCFKCHELEEKVKELQEKLHSKTKEGVNYVHCTSGRKMYKCEPKENDSACWWCCHTFDTIPIGLPEKYDKGEFHLYGHFCSFNCAHAYNIQLNDFKVWQRYSLLNLYKKKVYDISHNNVKIMPAAPKQLLKMFGGELTIEQFRENHAALTKEYRYMLPPYIPINGVVEEVNKTVTKLPQCSGNLKLKRNKPLPGMNNNLLQLMKKT